MGRRERGRRIMGISASKRVRNSLTNSPEFDSACNSTFSHCLALTQHAYDGVCPYQLCAAADHLHHLLTVVRPHPLIANWLPSPPTRLQVDSALRAVNRDDSNNEDETLGPIRFKHWAIELFSEAVAKNVGKKWCFEFRWELPESPESAPWLGPERMWLELWLHCTRSALRLRYISVCLDSNVDFRFCI